MKYVVFSDIHGNISAFLAMLNEIRGFQINGFIFCGDILGYFFNTRDIIRWFQRFDNLYAVLGNHDYYYLNMLNDTNKRLTYAEKYGKSYLENIAYEEKKYLSKLPKQRELYLEGKKIFIAHGSLEMLLEGRVYPDTIVDENLYQQYDIIILGHTHYQMYRRIGKTLLLNPGSLGQPRDYKGYSFCIIDLTSEECTFLNVNVDQTALIDELIVNGEKKELINYIQSKMRKLV